MDEYPEGPELSFDEGLRLYDEIVHAEIEGKLIAAAEEFEAPPPGMNSKARRALEDEVDAVVTAPHTSLATLDARLAALHFQVRLMRRLVRRRDWSCTPAVASEPISRPPRRAREHRSHRARRQSSASARSSGDGEPGEPAPRPAAAALLAQARARAA